MAYIAKKIRGADNSENFVIINDTFHKVTPELVSFEFIIADGSIPNIYCLGYSKPFQKLYIHFRNDKRYIYDNVSTDLWQKRHGYSKINEYYAIEIKGIGFFETKEYLKPVSPQYVLAAYEKLEYYKDTTCGLWATDRPDKVIDTDNVLFQLDF